MFPMQTTGQKENNSLIFNIKDYGMKRKKDG